MEQVVYNFWGKKEYQLNTNIIFKKHYMPIGKHILVIFLSFLSLGVHANLSEYWWVHGQVKFGNPWVRIMADYSLSVRLSPYK